jgi:hypothetical protein
MTPTTEGTVLTCSHGDCGCRIRIETECHCPDAGRPYTCSCGAPMIEVTVSQARSQPNPGQSPPRSTS